MILNERIEIKNTKHNFDYVEVNFTHTNNEYVNAIRRKVKYAHAYPRKVNLYVVKGDKILIPYGALSTEHIKNFEYTEIIDNTYFRENLFKIKHNKDAFDLEEYQEKAIKVIFEKFKKGIRGGILKAPTGSGKTIMGLELAKRLNTSVLWLTHRLDLVNQVKKEAKAYLDLDSGDIGEIKSGKIEIGNFLTIATVQTLANSDKEFLKDAFGLVIVDECHRTCGTVKKLSQFMKCLENVNAKYKIGLTATPDSIFYKKALRLLLGEIIYEIPQSEVKDRVVKCNYKNHIVSFIPLEKISGTDGTFDFHKIRTEVADTDKRNNFIVEKVVEDYEKNRNVLVATDLVRHAQALYKKVKDKGVSVEIVIGKTPKKERERIYGLKPKVLITTTSLIEEGFDLPYLDTIHLATPQKNQKTVIQLVGRVRRKTEDKEFATIVDYTDNDFWSINAQKVRMRAFKREKVLLEKKK